MAHVALGKIGRRTVAETDTNIKKLVSKGQARIVEFAFIKKIPLSEGNIVKKIVTCMKYQAYLQIYQ